MKFRNELAPTRPNKSFKNANNSRISRICLRVFILQVPEIQATLKVNKAYRKREAHLLIQM